MKFEIQSLVLISCIEFLLLFILKTFLFQIRGFHVLWHMSKDLGINRYICKFCDFGHDRKQAVVSHGRKEHGIEDCCEDHVEVSCYLYLRASIYMFFFLICFK